MSEDDSGLLSGAIPYAVIAAVAAVLWLKRYEILEWVKNAIRPNESHVSTNDQKYFESLIKTGNTDFLDAIIKAKTPDEWVPADNPYLSGYSMTIIPWKVE